MPDRAGQPEALCGLLCGQPYDGTEYNKNNNTNAEKWEKELQSRIDAINVSGSAPARPP